MPEIKIVQKSSDFEDFNVKNIGLREKLQKIKSKIKV